MLEGEAAADLSDLAGARRPSRRPASIPESIVGIRSPHLRGAGPRRCGAQHPRRRIDGRRGARGVPRESRAGLSPAGARATARRRSDHAYVRTSHAGARFERQSQYHAHRRAAARRSVRSWTRHPGLLVPQRRTRRAEGISSRRPLDRHGQDQPPAASGRHDDDALQVPESSACRSSSWWSASPCARPVRSSVRSWPRSEKAESPTLPSSSCRQGHFGFLDAGHGRLRGDRRLRAVLTIRGGSVVWDSEGLSTGDWSNAGPYTNYR